MLIHTKYKYNMTVHIKLLYWKQQEFSKNKRKGNNASKKTDTVLVQKN